MCKRSKIDKTFAKYPRLPVVQCSGYERDDVSKEHVSDDVQKKSNGA